LERTSPRTGAGSFSSKVALRARQSRAFNVIGYGHILHELSLYLNLERRAFLFTGDGAAGEFVSQISAIKVRSNSKLLRAAQSMCWRQKPRH